MDSQQNTLKSKYWNIPNHTEKKSKTMNNKTQQTIAEIYLEFHFFPQTAEDSRVILLATLG